MQNDTAAVRLQCRSILLWFIMLADLSEFFHILYSLYIVSVFNLFINRFCKKLHNCFYADKCFHGYMYRNFVQKNNCRIQKQ